MVFVEELLVFLFPLGEEAKGLFGLSSGLTGHLFIEFAEIFFDQPSRIKDRHLWNHGSFQAPLQKFGLGSLVEIVGCHDGKIWVDG